MGGHSRGVSGGARVLPAVPLAYGVYAEDAGPGPDLGSGQAGLGGDLVPLETPANLYGTVSLLHNAGDLGVNALVYHVRAEGKRGDFGRN